MKTIKFQLIILFLIIFRTLVFANVNIVQFSNSVDYQFTSSYLDYELRKSSTLIDNSLSSLNEKFQILAFTYSGLIFGTNINAAYNEKSSKRAGFDFIFGLGEKDDILACLSLGVTYQQELVFKELNKFDEVFSIQIGDFNESHFTLYMVDFFDAINRDSTPTKESVGDGYIDLALGYKKFLPIYFRLNDELAGVFINSPVKHFYYSYNTDKYFYHIQYYGKKLNLSLGRSGYTESYSLLEYRKGKDDKPVMISEIILAENKYKGIGSTFDINDLFSSGNTLSGEMHYLWGDHLEKKQSDRIIISKLGFKIYY